MKSILHPSDFNLGDHIIPKGFRVGESCSGTTEIFDKDNMPCMVLKTGKYNNFFIISEPSVKLIRK